MENFMKKAIKHAITVISEDGEVVGNVINGYNIWSLFEREQKPEYAPAIATFKVFLERRAKDGNERERRYARSALLLLEYLLGKEKIGYDIAIKELKENGLL